MKVIGKALCAIIAGSFLAVLAAGCGEKAEDPAKANEGKGQATETVGRPGRGEGAIHNKGQ